MLWLLRARYSGLKNDVWNAETSVHLVHLKAVAGFWCHPFPNIFCNVACCHDLQQTAVAESYCTQVTLNEQVFHCILSAPHLPNTFVEPHARCSFSNYYLLDSYNCYLCLEGKEVLLVLCDVQLLVSALLSAERVQEPDRGCSSHRHFFWKYRFH